MEPTPARTARRSPGWLDRRPARAGVLWTLACFAAAQGLFWAVREWARPELRDPEYVYKIERLRQRIRENPDRPLAVLLGSSRVAFGVRTDLLESNHQPDQRRPIVFNFGMCQCTPVLQRLMLQRLLDDGVRPDWLLVEFLPSVQVARDDQAEKYINPVRLTWADLRLLQRFTDHPWRLGLHWFEEQVIPWFTHRHVVMNRYAVGWVPGERRFDDNWRGMTDWGWTPREQFRGPMATDAFHEHLKKRVPDLQTLFSKWEVSPESDAAVREILTICRQRGIRVAVFWGPEPTWLSFCYGPGLVDRMRDYLDGLRRDYGAQLVDARGWVPDDQFYEEMHLTHAGAETCARKFESQALPLLSGRAGSDRADRGRR